LVVTSLKRSLRQLKKEIDTIEEKLLLLVNEVHKDVLTRLKKYSRNRKENILNVRGFNGWIRSF
jgi:hypothetical protein